jgi:hypothetical protein
MSSIWPARSLVGREWRAAQESAFRLQSPRWYFSDNYPYWIYYYPSRPYPALGSGIGGCRLIQPPVLRTWLAYALRLRLTPMRTERTTQTARCKAEFPAGLVKRQKRAPPTGKRRAKGALARCAASYSIRPQSLEARVTVGALAA